MDIKTDDLANIYATIPGENGHSHCEKEFTPVDNCLKGANVLLQTILDIDNN